MSELWKNFLITSLPAINDPITSLRPPHAQFRLICDFDRVAFWPVDRQSSGAQALFKHTSRERNRLNKRENVQHCVGFRAVFGLAQFHAVATFVAPLLIRLPMEFAALCVFFCLPLVKVLSHFRVVFVVSVHVCGSDY